jgi:serine/threonine protein kinase/WD40 repeat protein
MNPDAIPDPPRLRELFLRALDLPTPEARAAFLATQCADDEPLRLRIEGLLARHTDETFLAEPAIAPGPDSAAAEAAEAESPGTRIGGRYRLLEKLGEGGFGSVWMAEQDEPVRRRVALKIVKLGMDTREVIARFEAERQALALMDHPGIARVFDGGATDRGRPFFVMELVRGTAITEYCERRRLGIRDRLRLFVQVCEAVQHAHQKGVIHRDLKPSNVLVAEIDGRPQPKVIDFGVAKATAARLSPDTVFTRFRQVIGTPAYMSPEQAGGAPDDIDTRTDIYSLGVLLYELLTGRTPFDTRALLASGFEAVLRVIRDEEPPRPSTRLGTLSREQLVEVADRRQEAPRRLGQLVRGELDWITMRALEKDRSRRYATAQGFAHDVARFLRQEPVDAAPPSLGYRLVKFLRRNRTPVATLAAVGLILITATLLSLRLAVLARQARDQADTERDRALRAERETDRQRAAAEASAAESRQRLVRLSLGNGQLLEERGDAFGAALWFADALRQAPDPTSTEPNPRSRLESLLARSPSLASMLFHDGPVRSVRFSPRGDRLVSASDDGTARVWDAATGQPIGVPLRHAGAVRFAEFDDAGSRVLTQCDDGTARVWDATTGQPVTPPLGHRLPLKRARFADGGTIVVTASGRAAGPPSPAVNPPTPNPAQPPGTEDARHRAESEIRAWDAATGREVQAVLWRATDILDLAVDRVSRRFAASFANGALSLWNLGDGTEWVLRQAPQPKAESPTGSSEWPTWMLEPVVSPGTAFHSLAFTPGGSRLLAAAEDETVEIWILPAAGAGSALPGPRFVTGSLLRSTPTTRGLAVDPTGWRAASLERPGTVRIWNPAAGEPAGRLASAMGSPTGFAFGPDGQWLVVFGGEPGAAGSARAWEVATGQPATPTLHHEAPVTDADLDATRLVTAGEEGMVRVWFLASPPASSPPATPWPPLSPHVWEQAAELLAARRLDSDGTLRPLGANESKARWESLRTGGFPFPSATPAGIRAWHERQALRAETHGQWQAAVLHLDRLVRTQPEDDGLQSRLSRARARAALAALEQNP